MKEKKAEITIFYANKSYIFMYDISSIKIDSEFGFKNKQKHIKHGFQFNDANNVKMLSRNQNVCIENMKLNALNIYGQ